MTDWAPGGGGPGSTTTDSRPLAGRRVGVVREHHFPDGADPGLTPTFDAAVGTLGELGAELVDVALPHYPEMFAVNIATLLAESFAYHRPTLGSRWSDYGYGTRLALVQGAMVTGADFVQAQRARRVVQRELAALLGRVDVLVMPTIASGAPGYERVNDLDHLFGFIHTPYWDSTGNPVLVVPMGFTDGGLPLSLQLAAAPFAEALLVGVGDAFQQATDWHRRVPPMVADPVAGSGVPVASGLPTAPSGPPPPAAAPTDEAVATVSLLLSRAGVQVEGDELVHRPTGTRG
jgi:aspartyl-tRNA(Asn)/glutamyl-tRNA(Gln) amidotransferase subunit A